MSSKVSAVVAAIALSASAAVFAVPVLQIGTPDTGGNCAAGPYAAYTANSTNPTETNTNITDGSTLCVGGVYGPNTTSLGGQGAGNDYSGEGLPAIFDDRGAVLVVSVPDGSDASGLTIGGLSAFHSSTTDSYFPNNHDPVKDPPSDFLFFDIGNFANNAGAVQDFDTNTGAADGQVLSLTIAGTGTLAWIHFDVIALETISRGGGPNGPTIVTNLENNPGSHDVTWKNPGFQQVPEPSSLLLLGIALLGLVVAQRRMRQR